MGSPALEVGMSGVWMDVQEFCLGNEPGCVILWTAARGIVGQLCL